MTGLVKWLNSGTVLKCYFGCGDRVGQYIGCFNRNVSVLSPPLLDLVPFSRRTPTMRHTHHPTCHTHLLYDTINWNSQGQKQGSNERAIIEWEEQPYHTVILRQTLPCSVWDLQTHITSDYKHKHTSVATSVAAKGLNLCAHPPLFGTWVEVSLNSRVREQAELLGQAFCTRLLLLKIRRGWNAYCSSSVAWWTGAVQECLWGAENDENGVIQQHQNLNHILIHLSVRLEEEMQSKCCNGDKRTSNLQRESQQPLTSR
jgi:hypothetical protein